MIRCKPILILALLLTAGCGTVGSFRTIGQHDPGVDTARALATSTQAQVESLAKSQTESVKALAEALVAMSRVQAEAMVKVSMQSQPQIPVNYTIPVPCRADNFTLVCASAAVVRRKQ